jgi:hypothetical protein
VAIVYSLADVPVVHGWDAITTGTTFVESVAVTGCILTLTETPFIYSQMQSSGNVWCLKCVSSTLPRRVTKQRLVAKQRLVTKQRLGRCVTHVRSFDKFAENIVRRTEQCRSLLRPHFWWIDPQSDRIFWFGKLKPVERQPQFVELFPGSLPHACTNTELMYSFHHAVDWTRATMTSVLLQSDRRVYG